MDLWRGISRRLADSLDSHRSEEEYQLLATDSPPSRAGHAQHRRRSPVQVCLRHLPLRRILAFVILIPILFLLGVLWSGVPPNFGDIREFERNLPQHHSTQSLAEGRKYIRFPDHLWGHGFNNVLQEALLLHYVAEKSDRSYVFEDYVWSHLPFRYTLYDFALRPVRLPLNAFISGPTAGRPVANNAAISTEFWNIVCPPNMRRVISSKDSPSDAEGRAIVDWWVERLQTVHDDCVEIDSKEKVIFDLLQPESIPALYDFSANTTLTGLVALHLRRGDFKRHCPRLAGWKAQYNGLNRLPELPDKFDSSLYAYESDEYNDYYAEHCLPTVEQLVSRLSAIRKEHRGLNRIYVLTNAWGFWLNGLKQALLNDGWESFRSTLDLSLDPKQTQVAAAIDMTIAEKSQIFIGNGVGRSYHSLYS
ncbi:hypothetical protein C0993_005191 [Termitomyces sp. T159_Od127]|nr:hypothetical protein C0993_005191 [Termitomyces sp. T159_Od127]